MYFRIRVFWRFWIGGILDFFFWIFLDFGIYVLQNLGILVF